METKGACCWIMTPFASRISNGKYNFNGTNLQLAPITPCKHVMHGFTSHELFQLESANISTDFVEVILSFKKIRKGTYSGYPFDVNVYISFKLGITN